MERVWLLRNWRVFLVGAAVTAALVVVVELLLWGPARPYAVGALCASGGWAIYVLMLETGGMTSKRSGIVGEEWTAYELRRLRDNGWMVINHVMIDKYDVDHAVIGPGGYLAVNTKFKSDWSHYDRYIEEDVRAAVTASYQLGSRLGLRHPTRVTPIIAMWGPTAPPRRDVDGVLFLQGAELRTYIQSLPTTLSPAEIEAAFACVDTYVRKRDDGELATDGPVPKAAAQIMNTWMVVAAVSLSAALCTLAPLSLRPMGWWSVVTGATITGIALIARHRWASSTSRYLTTATISTSAGIALVMFGALAAEALH